MATKSAKKADAVISTDDIEEGPVYPEGTHPARPASEVEHSADKFSYRDNPDKPDASSVAQIED